MSRRRWRSWPSRSPGPAWDSFNSSGAARAAPRSPPYSAARGTSMAFLEIQTLRKSFGANTVVQSFDLAIERGEFVSLLGPSGCGKTTVLRMVAGFETPTSGSIRIDGKEIVGLRPNQRKVGM